MNRESLKVLCLFFFLLGRGKIPSILGKMRNEKCISFQKMQSFKMILSLFVTDGKLETYRVILIS